MHSIKWTVSIFSSIVQLKQSKGRVFLKGIYNNIFAQCCKIWNDKKLNYLYVKCYVTILSLPLHRENYTPILHFISYLIDHQIQMLKRRKRERFPQFQFPPLLCTLSQRYWLQLSVLFPPNNMEKSQITTNLPAVVILLLQQKRSKKKDTTFW